MLLNDKKGKIMRFKKKRFAERKKALMRKTVLMLFPKAI